MHPVSKGRGACRGTRRGSKRSAWAPGRTAPRGPVPPTRASPTPAVTRRPRLRISAHRPRSGRGTRDRLAAVVLHAMDRAVPVRDDGAGAGLALPGHVDGGQEDGVGLRELVEFPPVVESEGAGDPDVVLVAPADPARILPAG